MMDRAAVAQMFTICRRKTSRNLILLVPAPPGGPSAHYCMQASRQLEVSEATSDYTYTEYKTV